MSHLSRRLSPATLFMLSMNGIVGSGWLLAPLYVAKIAGSAAMLSWIVGGMAAMLIAFTFAELSTMFPVAGGTAHIPQLSHGPFASFILSWIAWLTSLLLVPIEVQAVLQYASIYFPHLMHVVHGIPVLSAWGYLWASILMMGLCVLNIVSYQGLIRFNFILFIFKFSVIFIAIAALMSAQFHFSNFDNLVQSTQSIAGWKAILSAVAAGGVVLAFNGFKSGVELAGEAKNLAVSIPLSTVGAVLGCLIIYLGLQAAFIGALSPDSFKQGWEHLSFSGDAGPFVGLAAALGLVIILKLIYANAVISPLGAGLIYVTSTARILFAMSRIGYVPAFLSKLNHQHFPVNAILVNFVLGMLSFLPFPGWKAMMNFLVSAIVITYAMGPISVLSLRLSLPNQKRPFKLPAAPFLCLFAFYCCNLFSFWTGWATISKLAIALSIGMAFFAISYLRGSLNIKREEIRSAWWIFPYLGGLVLISYLGTFGGIGVLPFGWDFVVIGLFSIVILVMAVYQRAEVSEAQLKDFFISENLH